jgi:cysteine-rich repeat protein
MPVCDSAASDGSCQGTAPTTFTGEGLAFARSRIRDYRGNSAPFPQTDQTRYVNILITDGETSAGSASVQDALSGLIADGVKTYVIGFGTSDELDHAQLDQYAVWGDTQQAIVVDPSRAESAELLAKALAGIVSSLGLDACCVLNQCASEPEPADPQAVCGDGKREGDEVCDDGDQNSSYGHCNARCDGQHLFCGDGRLDGPEECDDGNKRDRDGCSSQCVAVADELDAGSEQGGPQSRVGDVPAGARRMPATSTPAVASMRAPATAQAGTLALDAAVSALPPARTSGADEGCGCHTVGAPQPPRVALVLLCVALLLQGWLRRRRS